MPGVRNTKILTGAEAKAYADTHLEKVRVDPDSWEIEYVDPVSGEYWVMDYPLSEMHGGGPPRLRRKTSTEP